MSEKMPGSRASVQAEKEPFPELLPEFQELGKSRETVQASQKGSLERQATDHDQADRLLEKLTASAPQPFADSVYEKDMNEEHSVSAQNFAQRAYERNKRRMWSEKLFGRGKVTAEDMSREDAKATYVKISNLKRSPGFYGNGMQGPEYNTMGSAMRKGASESELSQVAADTNPAHYRSPGWVQSFAKFNAESVAREKDQRVKQGLPTDVLNSDIEFAQAQQWEQKQREQKEKRAA
ncbi:MAG TPA: hypothetical protein VJI70_00120 [Candidatus Paceibacterota bacterium]